MNTELELLAADKMTRLHKSAKSRGIEFGLSFETVKQLLSAETCYYTGIKLSAEHNALTQRTIDRVDNSKGYIDGNVVASTKYINGKKSDLTLEEIELMYFKTHRLNRLQQILIKLFK